MKQSKFSIPTEVNMSTSQVDVTSDSECSEVEGVIKLDVDEKQLPKLQYIYETDEDTDEDPLDEDNTFEKLPPRKQRIYNEMVDFQRELRQHGLAGSLNHIIHAQQEKINPTMPDDVAGKEMATATASTSIVKTEIMSTSAGPIQHITSILIKEEPLEIHVTKIVDAYKSELLNIPEHLFDQGKMRT